MRRLCQLCCALILACLLTPSALADGIMHPEIVPPPTETVAGIMHPEQPVAGTTTTSAALEIVLSLINLLGRV